MSEMQPTFRPAAEQKRILLVEDEPINQEILKMYLADTYDVLLAGTGKEALEFIRFFALCSQHHDRTFGIVPDLLQYFITV